MADTRFSLLERDRGDDDVDRSADEEVRAEDRPARPTTRALERDGELGLDASDASRTHFCRACEAETRAGVASCYNCGGSIGGPDQALFDDLRRRELATAADEKERTRRRKRAVESGREELRREREREAEIAPGQHTPARGRPGVARSQGFDPRLALGVVVVCLFATISATVHLFLSAAYSDHVNWNVLAEVLIAAIATWIVFTALGQRSG